MHSLCTSHTWLSYGTTPCSSWPCLNKHHICIVLCRWLNPTVFEYYMICFAKALVQRWADPSASRPDTAVYFHVAQEYVDTNSPQTLID